MLQLLVEAGVLERGKERNSLQDKITVPGTRRRERVYRLDRAAMTAVLAEARVA